MAMTQKSGVIRFTADNDTYSPGLGRIKIKGCRLVAGADAATAQIKLTDTNGQIIYSLKAAAAGTDESHIEVAADASTIHVDMTGTSPEVFLYLE